MKLIRIDNMVRFIYGNPGTGKTQLVYSYLEKDAAEGNNALLIVPEQMTVAAERDVVKLLPPSSQLNIEVLNFSRLARFTYLASLPFRISSIIFR